MIQSLCLSLLLKQAHLPVTLLLLLWLCADDITLTVDGKDTYEEVKKSGRYRWVPPITFTLLGRIGRQEAGDVTVS